jgi:hypothetical protein
VTPSDPVLQAHVVRWEEEEAEEEEGEIQENYKPPCLMQYGAVYKKLAVERQARGSRIIRCLLYITRSCLLLVVVVHMPYYM